MAKRFRAIDAAPASHCRWAVGGSGGSGWVTGSAHGGPYSKMGLGQTVLQPAHRAPGENSVEDGRGRGGAPAR
eukprot:CAMPEP_0174378276 /NCGR_PEP_ID=MMETSP0811_2-20130205/121950_1 /TAXON_ID=73025 ORGANISM="Eutreptiella gymnastica-like, Strain CCMP1594" /NCGR_SAMPLE_ID=MMETSP0811_2 /ASSEMBLY_ACC=CAM_ASM_000667 /LENGTH=72 /DNA_ID=CAMNT_0015530451 /DNA_START=966 /DNA_END=1181 /DNA_ORIENTATION=+